MSRGAGGGRDSAAGEVPGECVYAHLSFAYSRITASAVSAGSGRATGFPSWPTGALVSTASPDTLTGSEKHASRLKGS